MPSVTRLVLLVAVLVTLLTTTIGVAAALPPPQAPNNHANAVGAYAALAGANYGNGDTMRSCTAQGFPANECGAHTGYYTALEAREDNGPSR